MKDEYDYDIIIWGATGFTGKLVVEYFKDNAPRSLRWAIGGRDSKKLDEIKTELGVDVDVVTGDNSDLSSIDSAVKRTRVIMSMVGPYSLLGKNIVKSCVKNEVHYVDITGESDYVRYLIQQFHDEARDKKILIVPCCGFDSIPSDLGTYLAVKTLEKKGKTCRKVKSCIFKLSGGFSGGTINSMYNFVTLPKDKKKECLRPYALNPPPEDTKKGESDQLLMRYDRDFKWTVPFIMAIVNTRVVRRSNALLNYNKEFTYSETMRVGGIFMAFLVTFALIMLNIILMIAPVRNTIRSFFTKIRTRTI